MDLIKASCVRRDKITECSDSSNLLDGYYFTNNLTLQRKEQHMKLENLVINKKLWYSSKVNNFLSTSVYLKHKNIIICTFIERNRGYR